MGKILGWAAGVTGLLVGALVCLMPSESACPLHSAASAGKILQEVQAPAASGESAAATPASEARSGREDDPTRAGSIPVWERSAPERLDAMREACERRDANPFDLLVRLLDDSNAIIRGEAAETLGRAGDARALAPLTAALSDPNPTVRLRAATGLGLLRMREAVPALLAALSANMIREDGYAEPVRVAIVEALGRIGDKSATEALAAELGRRESIDYRNHVVAALGNIGDAAGSGAVSRFLADLEAARPVESIALAQWRDAVATAKDSLKRMGQ